MSTEFLQGLIRRLHTVPEVSAAYLGGDLAQPGPEGVERIEFFLVASPAFRQGMPAWLAPLGETAFSGPEGEEGWRLVTPEGVEWLIRFALPASTDGLQALFDRRVPAEGEASPAETLDLALMAGRFWADLHRAARALGQGQPLTAHGRLEGCRRALVDLYRLALAPREQGQGWEGADRVAALHPVREWLVAPLDSRAQWRSAHRLASAYESLMLPLCQRLGVPYPMAMRNLAFERLDKARPDPSVESAPPRTEPLPLLSHDKVP